jgi:hypothetical protein
MSFGRRQRTYLFNQTMKPRIKFLSIAFVATVCLLFKYELSNSNIEQPAAGNNGAPNTVPPNQTCAQCHSGAGAQQNAVPNVDFSFNDGTTDVPVASFKYELNKEYTVRYRPLTTSKAYGFQMSALTSTNANGGSFTLTDPNTTTLISTPTNYIAHHNASSFHNWSFKWTAPATNLGDITFYYVFNASDSNLAQTGDTIYVGNSVVQPASTTGIAHVTAINNLSVYPNPASDFVTVAFNTTATEKTQLNVFSTEGKWLKTLYEGTASNNFSTTANIADLPTGIYLLQIKTGNNLTCRKIVVQ